MTKLVIWPNCLRHVCSVRECWGLATMLKYATITWEFTLKSRNKKFWNNLWIIKKSAIMQLIEYKWSQSQWGWLILIYFLLETFLLTKSHLKHWEQLLKRLIYNNNYLSDLGIRFYKMKQILYGCIEQPFDNLH